MAAPKGNRNGAHDKPWTNALERALAQYEAGEVKAGQALRKIADGVVRDAIAGDKDARQEIANRLDGRPTEHVHQHRHDTAASLDDAEIARQLAAYLDGRENGQGSGEEQSRGVH